MFGNRMLLRAAVVLATPLVLAGCYHSHNSRHHVSSHPTAFATPSEFTWTGDLVGYDATDEYLWDTVWDEVFIEFEALHFFGEVRVQIFDHFFDEIYDETFFGSGGDLLVQTSSELGFSGEWRIVINSFDVDGDVTLRLD